MSRRIDVDDRIACQGHRLDFTELTATSAPADVADARAACSNCPALFACLTYLETADVAGFAGGMFEHQRDAWRDRDGKELERVTIADVSEAAELHGAIIDDVDATRNANDQRLSREVVAIVFRLTNAGFTAEEIVERLGMPRITYRTITYLRHSKGMGGLTAHRKTALRWMVDQAERRRAEDEHLQREIEDAGARATPEAATA